MLHVRVSLGRCWSGYTKAMPVPRHVSLRERPDKPSRDGMGGGEGQARSVTRGAVPAISRYVLCALWSRRGMLLQLTRSVFQRSRFFVQIFVS